MSALITKAEAARIMGLSRYVITRLCDRGALEEVRIAPGMGARVRRSSVEALLEDWERQGRVDEFWAEMRRPIIEALIRGEAPAS